MPLKIFKYLKNLSICILLVLLSVFTANSQNCGNRYQTQLFPQIGKVTLQYGSNTAVSGATQNLMADFYRPLQDTLAFRPLVIMMFGGGFVGGSRQDTSITGTCRLLAGLGYVSAGIDYRIGYGGSTAAEVIKTIYRATQDCLAAVRYFRKNAVIYGIDSNQIFVGGFSAGAITAHHAAFWDQAEANAYDTTGLGPLKNSGGTPNISNRIAGVIAAAGAIGDTLWLDNNPGIPVGMVHNTSDPTVPYGQGTLPFVGLSIYGSGSIHKHQILNNRPSKLKTLNAQGVHLPTYGSALADTMYVALRSYLYQMQACNNVVSGLPSPKMVKVMLFPNPTTTIIASKDVPLNSQYSITNVMGKTVSNGIWPSSQSVDIAQLPEGLYYINWHYQNQSFTSTFIKACL